MNNLLDSNVDMDVMWVAEQLLLGGHIVDKEYQLIKTSVSRSEQTHPFYKLTPFALKDALSNKRIDVPWLTAWLAAKAGIKVHKIDPLKISVAAVTAIMSSEFAENHRILCVDVADNEVTIATDMPYATGWQALLAPTLAGKAIRLVMVAPDQLSRYIGEFYHVSRAVKGAGGLGFTSLPGQGVDALLQLGNIKNPDANDQHVINIVDWILQNAFDLSASDIHLEPRREGSRIRLRIDGVLHTVYEMNKQIMMAVIARIKILGRLNVAEKRKPQDGRLKTRTASGVETELRLSTLPTAVGEKMVLRIFDPDVLVRNFEQLGLYGDDMHKWDTMTAHPNGIILVTGPTGSGKTTTLYSTLKQLANDDVNVCTIEDPIEMLEPSFNQMQINPTIDVGFAEGIRALMRQDPDIIMVGEIRDSHTAEMAVQAALTGHLVLSTVHTNDAPSTIARLHDLGVPPYLSSATILGVMAQRLVRKLCPACKVQQPIDVQAWQQLVSPWQSSEPSYCYAAVGCDQCRQTGYKGRIGLYEVMVLSNKLKKLIAENASQPELKEQAFREGLLPLRLAGAKKIAEGVTTFAEVFKVAPLN